MPDSTTPHEFSSHTLAALHKHLLRWFDSHQRRLPWRTSRDPYRIWVSEVMLQQTTVAAVIPRFTRFLEVFPTLTRLAQADEQEVLKLWEGLGYYRRARHLHQAARRIHDTFGDEIPDDPSVWAELPGVGRYMLGAVLSQAFDCRLPVVEANTLRVLSRLHGSPDDPRTGTGKKWVWAAAERLLPTQRVGDWNQALMEVGAVVCKPDEPHCAACPLKKRCVANRLGLQASIPPPPKKKAATQVREVAIIMKDGERILLAKRSQNAGRWAKMWEIPHGEIHDKESAVDAVSRVVRELTGLEVKPGRKVGTIRHNVTRFAVTMTAYEAEVRGGTFQSDLYCDGRWMAGEEWKELPLSTPQRTLLQSWMTNRSADDSKKGSGSHAVDRRTLG